MWRSGCGASRRSSGRSLPIAACAAGGRPALRAPAAARKSNQKTNDPVLDSHVRLLYRMIGAMKRDVGAELEVDITAPTTLEFQIAVAPQPGADVHESLSFVLDGTPIQAQEISGTHGNRIHKFDAGVGHLRVDYSAT